MRFATTATVFASMAYNASAFGVRQQKMSKRAFTSSATRLHANVPKLSEPKSQLLDDVDVFIFDCDGVIWRVRLSAARARCCEFCYYAYYAYSS
jgi:hypothetical protein